MRCASPSPIRTAISGRAFPICSPPSAARAFSSRPAFPLIRLQDIRFPESYLAAFEGPRFGVAGLRERLQAFDRPIFFGVIKPNIGLSAEPFAELGYQSWLGGLDIAKDDEMLADVGWCPLAERAAALGEARRRAESETGTPKIYLANITDEVDRLAYLHDIAVAKGANALLINAMPVGLSGVRMLRKHATVPLIAHFPFIAAFSRLPGYGIHSRVLTRLQRLAGFDSVIMPGFGSRMMTPEHEVLDCVRACLEPMGSYQALSSCARGQRLGWNSGRRLSEGGQRRFRVCSGPRRVRASDGTARRRGQHPAGLGCHLARNSPRSICRDPCRASRGLGGVRRASLN